MVRTRDAEAELNLPPGFRFHPTDDELVVHYLCRKASHQRLPVPIIAELDLYKFDPWQLPDMALFGNREWYFFTPRDRKYPKGSRPNRAAGGGYWKATGADKPISPAGNARPLGIKKALVFYAGKSPHGVKTDWIMHEYRLAEPYRAAATKKADGSLRLDDWVLCRLYNKKNKWGKTQRLTESSAAETMDSFDDTGSDSFRTLDSDVDNEEHMEHGRRGKQPLRTVPSSQLALYPGQPPGATTEAGAGVEVTGRIKEEDDWFGDLNLDGLQNPAMAFAGAPPSLDFSYQDYLSALASTQLKPSDGMLPPF